MYILFGWDYIEDYYKVETVLCVGNKELVFNAFEKIVNIQKFKALRYRIARNRWKSAGYYENVVLPEEEDFFKIEIKNIEKTGEVGSTVKDFSTENYSVTMDNLYDIKKLNTQQNLKVSEYNFHL